MALSVQIFPANATTVGTSPNLAATQPGYAIANSPLGFLVILTNGATDPARTINSIVLAETTESECAISQPNFLTPNVAQGVGNPVIAAGATLYFTGSVVFQSPNFPGVSPGNQPGGTAPGNRAEEPDALFTIQAQVVSADGQVVTASVMVPVLSAMTPPPSLQGGALQLNNPMNLASFLAAFA